MHHIFVHEFGLERLGKAERNLQKICQSVVEDAIEEKGCQDNSNAIIIQFVYEDMDPKPFIVPSTPI